MRPCRVDGVSMITRESTRLARGPRPFRDGINQTQATVFFCLFMMFDGHYINNKSIPAGAKWIEDANFFNWAISAGSRSELLGLGDLHGCSNPESSRCIFQRGGDAVDYYGFRDKPFRKAITAIMLISVALRALAFVAFKFLFTGRPVFDSCSSKKQ
mmetsp:Transcript_5659/g.16795  ORF Transcript_5659/g.16795 Transcript_5659/m.16795 type:complete len:157 (+) Transcript_5659:1805-2275(+)